MKKVIVIIMLSVLSSVTFSEDSLVFSDSVQIETIISDTASKVEITLKEEKAIENAQKNAQWFMYGFLALGAFLVFWKFKNNKYKKASTFNGCFFAFKINLLVSRFSRL